MRQCFRVFSDSTMPRCIYGKSNPQESSLERKMSSATEVAQSPHTFKATHWSPLLMEISIPSLFPQCP